MRKNKNNNEEDYNKIRDYYNRALIALESDEPAQGGKIIHYEMPVDLYDLSLDILDNKNDVFSDQSLRALIEKVDVLLVDYSNNGEDDESDIIDEFSNNAF